MQKSLLLSSPPLLDLDQRANSRSKPTSRLSADALLCVVSMSWAAGSSKVVHDNLNWSWSWTGGFASTNELWTRWGKGAQGGREGEMEEWGRTQGCSSSWRGASSFGLVLLYCCCSFLSLSLSVWVSLFYPLPFCFARPSNMHASADMIWQKDGRGGGDPALLCRGRRGRT